MGAIAVSADGENVFVALEDGSGYPIFARADRDDLSTWATAYNPGAGSAANVAQVPSDPDKMLFYGNFGTHLTVIEHTISTVANSDISPLNLGAYVVNGLAVNPADGEEIIATANTDQDMFHTTDGGDNWETLDSALGFDVTALVVVWQTEAEYHLIYTGGQVTGAARVEYSPNTASYFSDVTGAALAAASVDVVGMEAGYVA